MSLDRLSGRIAGIRLSTSWRDKVGTAGLAKALVYAVLKARLGYIGSRTVDPARGTDSDALGTALSAKALADLTPERQREAWCRMADLLESANAEATAAIGRLQSGLGAGAESEDSPPEPTGSDDRRNVLVTLNASGALSDLSFDEKWLNSASTERVAVAVREAFQAAYASLDLARGASQPSRTPAADRIIALTNDPARLTRWLRQED